MMGIREKFLTVEKNMSWNILHRDGAEPLLWEILKNRHIRNKIISCSQCKRLYDLSKYFTIFYDNTEVFRKLSN